jgi:ParB family chromosome partitioning protein
MMDHIREVKEIEIAHLVYRYAHTRIERPEKVSSLAGSIERCGQIIPVISLEEGPCCYVLLDGYLRVMALKRCGKDTVLAEIWQCREEEALIEVLARGHTRKWDVIEEAALIRELRDRHHLCQAQIASMLGRKQGWVSGRLGLYEVLCEDVLDLVRRGCVSTWAATRILAPIARAMPDHAKRLAETMIKEPISTRDLALFFSHYQRANRRQRDRMVLEPGLFLKALHCREKDKEAESLKGGPEGRWMGQIKTAGHILRRLLKELPSVFYPGQSTMQRRLLLTAFKDTKEIFLSLDKAIRRFMEHDQEPDQRGHLEFTPAGDHDQGDQPHSQDLQEHSEKAFAGEGGRDSGQTLPP